MNTSLLVILGFVVYKLGDRVSTIVELLAAFVTRGHWYLMPMVVVLLTVGSLLVILSYTLGAGSVIDGGMPGTYPWPVFAAGMLVAAGRP